MINGAVIKSERMIPLYRELQNRPRYYAELVAIFSDRLTADQVGRALSSLRNRGFIEFNGKWKLR